MQNWQKQRNYRSYKHPDGTFTYIITVDSEDVEVSEDVFKAYSQADRRERYCAERDVGMFLSLECMAEENVMLSYLADRKVESAEDAAMRQMQIRQALESLSLLDEDERNLFQAIVLDEVTEKGYADLIGVSQSTVHRRAKRIHKKVTDMMCIKSLDFREGQ